ncbi:hypothetical protein NHX12_011312 [Muraenolepis orangiensis]|uniref:H/ACA ribonucleoprotein complex subunit n=1 Tax=Muraenolepis orangiensis TaxID=630683 RepID=A0A9Q0DFL7_9TELE|nr:hypothetical protein NHX12_011312 [Muraenolepis orangiensis]
MVSHSLSWSLLCFQWSLLIWYAPGLPWSTSLVSPRQQDYGPPEYVVAVGEFVHPCEDDVVCKCTTEENKVPYFNAPVYLENKEQIGKVDEIFGQIRDFYFSVKLSDNMKASSFKKLQKFYIDPMKLLPLQRFLPRPPGEKGPPRGAGGEVAVEVEGELAPGQDGLLLPDVLVPVEGQPVNMET